MNEHPRGYGPMDGPEYTAVDPDHILVVDAMGEAAPGGRIVLFLRVLRRDGEEFVVGLDQDDVEAITLRGSLMRRA